MDDDGLVHAIERHQVELSERWARIQGGHVWAEPDMVLFVVGEPVAFTNGVRRARLDPATADQRIAHAIEVFRRHGVPAIWWVGPESEPPDLGARLEAHGFRHDDEMPWMAATLDDWTDVPMPRGYEIARVDGAARQALWLEAMTVGFEMDEPTRRVMTRLADAVGAAEEAPWQRWVALEGRRPVASSGLMLGGGVAGIYNVATAPRARGRGIGAAMTSVAAARARELGYRIAVLGSSPRAIPLYERLGFRWACTLSQYLWEEPVSSS